MFDESVVQDLVAGFDLLAEVERLVKLEKQGRFYIGPCPACGGTDRFNLTLTPGGWRWHCRKCASGKYYNAVHMMERLWHVEFKEAIERMLQGRTTMTEEERLAIAIERARRAQEELEAARLAAEDKLAELRNAHAWERYHDNLNDITRQLWQYRGVPDFWQDWWQLGYDPKHHFWTKQGEFESPTLTIPIFGNGFADIRNIKHRLLSPREEGDKYRPEAKGLPPAMWVSDPERPICGPTLVVEGEIKGMVTAATYDDERLMVAGLPGKTPGVEVVAMLADADPVYLCMDPDVTEEEVARLVDALGAGRVRRIKLPIKIDDAILKYKLDKHYLRALIAQAGKVVK